MNILISFIKAIAVFDLLCNRCVFWRRYSDYRDGQVSEKTGCRMTHSIFLLRML